MTPTALSQIEFPGSSQLVVSQVHSPELMIDPLLDRFDLQFLGRKYWKRLVLLPALGGAAALALALTQQPLFESEAVILVDPSFDMIIQIENVQDGQRSDLEALKSLEVAIMSDSIMLRVVNRLDLRNQEGFLPKDLVGPDVSDLKILKYLRKKRFKANLIPETRLIQLLVLDPKPERAQQIANALSNEFEAFLGEQRKKEVGNVRVSLQKQAEQARLTALESEGRLKEFRESHPHFPVEQDHQLYADRLTQFGEQLNSAKGLRMELESEKNVIEKLDPETSPIEIIRVANYNEMAHVSVVLDSLAASRAKLSIVEEKYTETHPEYRITRAEVKRNETELAELAKGIKAAVTADYLAEASREKILTEELDKAQSSFVEMKTYSSEFRAIQQQTERDWTVHQSLQSKLSESAVSTELASQIATVVSEPMVPFKKSKPSLLLYLVLGGFAGGLLAGGGVLVAVLSGLPFSSTRQLEQRLGLPVIADWSGSKKSLQSAHSTALLRYIGGNRYKTIQISAPQLNGVGESVAHQVAVTAAQNGRRTLLILIKTGDADLEIRPAQIDNLYLLEVTPDTVRSQDRFPAGLRQLRNDFDNIFIEAGSAEDLELVDLLSSYADQDVVVVGKDKTSKQLIDDRVTKLSKPGSPPIALIMVGVD